MAYMPAVAVYDACVHRVLFPSPERAGLSLLTEKAEEEAVVPGGSVHFATHGDGFWVGSQEVEREPAQDGKVFGGCVFPGTIGVFCEDDIEDPVHLVLDRPMGSDDLEQFLGWYTQGKNEVPDGRLFCRLA